MKQTIEPHSVSKHVPNQVRPALSAPLSIRLANWLRESRLLPDGAPAIMRAREIADDRNDNLKQEAPEE
jgi:hypothetical protein